ncbi:MAG: response regulator transcription factor [Planctomycetes bacterium]|nr:response regulator transcription factor [Planctomycetota bacterium]
MMVYFIDDDTSVLDALMNLAKTHGLNALAFSSAVEFLGQEEIVEPGCIVADLRMPRLSGLELQSELAARGIELPLIMISGHADIDSAVTAMRHGATDFLTKPFDPSKLIERIRHCLAQDQQRIEKLQRNRDDQRRVDSFTPRERQVFDLLLEGFAGKQIAQQLGVSYRTMEKFRANVMRKTAAGSVANLVQIGTRLGLVAANSKRPE